MVMSRLLKSYSDNITFKTMPMKKQMLFLKKAQDTATPRAKFSNFPQCEFLIESFVPKL
jgi:hypothetical protein